MPRTKTHAEVQVSLPCLPLCNHCHAGVITVMLVQALRPGVQKSQDGSFRATFEDKPLMSDIVFLRAWIGVDLPKFYNPVTNLLAPAVRLAPRELKPGHMAAEVGLPFKMQQHPALVLPSLRRQCVLQRVA